MITNDRKSATRSIKDLINEAHHLPDLSDDAFEGMLVDEAFISGWFSIRKIKGRCQPKEKSTKEPAD